jgi:hypothetical protein
MQAIARVCSGVNVGAGVVVVVVVVVVVEEPGQPTDTKATTATVPINSFMSFTVNLLCYRKERVMNIALGSVRKTLPT